MNINVNSENDVQCGPPKFTQCMIKSYLPPYVECTESHEKCKKCFKYKCERFTSGTLKCEECDEGFSLATAEDSKSGCRKDCTVTEYFDFEKNTCLSCRDAIEGCLECKNSEEDKNKLVCLKCQPEFVDIDQKELDIIRHENNKPCLPKCPQTAFLNAKGVCEDCSNKMDRCSLCQTGETCVRCEEGFMTKEEASIKGIKLEENSKACLSKCGTEQVLNEKGECLDCKNLIDNCQECSKGPGSKYTCHKCRENYFTRTKEEETLNFIPESIDCIRKCKEDEVLYPYNQCKTCLSVFEKCSDCKKSLNNWICEGCQEGFITREQALKQNGEQWYIPPTGFCVRKCNDESLLDEHSNCKLCKDFDESFGDYCSRCKMTPEYEYRCLECKEGYKFSTFNDGKKRCVKSCKEGQVWMPPNNCEACEKNCIECFPESKHCKQCYSDSFEVNQSNLGKCLFSDKNPTDKVELNGAYFDSLDSAVVVHVSTDIVTKDFNKELKVSLFTKKNNSKLEAIKTTIQVLNNTRGLLIEIEFLVDEFDGYMIISDTGPASIEAAGSPDTFFLEDEIKVDKIIVYSDGVVEALKSTQKVAEVTGMTFNFLLLLSNPAFGILFLRLMHTFAIYRFINIHLPMNMKAFFSFFDNSILDLVPNPFETTKDEIGCREHNTIFKGNEDCLLINNGGVRFILQPLIYTFLKIGSFLLLATCSPKKKKSGQPENQKGITKVLNSVYNKLNPLFFLKTFKAIRLKLLIALSINMHYFTTSGTIFVINSIISLILLVSYYSFSIFALTFSIRLEKRSDVKMKEQKTPQNLAEPARIIEEKSERDEKKFLLSGLF